MSSPSGSDWVPYDYNDYQTMKHPGGFGVWALWKKNGKIITVRAALMTLNEDHWWDGESETSPKPDMIAKIILPKGHPD